MTTGAIEAIAEQLEASGHDSGELRDLQEELDGLEAPPGFFSVVSTKALSAARKQWAHVMGELQESAEAMGILRRALNSEDGISAEEADTVRDQLWDLVRVVPASIIAVANAALPVPGTGLLTPWILHRLGVMPSRWREAHLLSQLQAESGRLRDEGLNAEATALDQLREDLEQEADEREQVARDAALLTYWDANKNGVWDDEERAAYQAAVDQVRQKATACATQKRWFFLHEEAVIGPIRLSTYTDEDMGPKLLVCWDGCSGWVSLQEVLEQ